MFPSRHFIVAAATAGFVALATFSCGDSTDPPSAKDVDSLSVSLQSGDAQTGLAGGVLAQPIAVVVKTEGGQLVPGAPVTWTVTGGGGALSAGVSTTDTQGRAAVTWTLGSALGAQAASASVVVSGDTVLRGSPVAFSATATATLAAESGDAQSAPAGAALGNNLVVKIEGAPGISISGVTVNWTVDAGGGTLAAATSTTNAQGLASMAWTLGGVLGMQTASATAAAIGGAPVTFNATGTGTIAVQSGNDQTGPVNVMLGAPLVVAAAGAAPLQGVEITWAIISGAGVLSASVDTTDVQGLASINWTLGALAGIQTVTASSPALTGSPITFSATGTAIAQVPTSVVIVSGDNQTAAVGTQIPAPLIAKVVDGAGAGVPGFPVSWVTQVGSGSLSLTVDTTDASGETTVLWILGATAGAQASQVTAPGLAGSPLQFAATATSGAPAPAATIMILSGNNQTAAVGTQIPLPLIAKVTDSTGAAVPGFVVTWAVGAGSGNVSLATDTTDVGGETTVIWTLGATVGAQTASVSAPGLTGSPLAFNATGTSGAPTPTNIAIVSGNSQSATVGTQIPLPLIAKVTDAGGAAVPNFAVGWSLPNADGSLSTTADTTDVGGETTVTWILGTTVGAQMAQADATGLTGSPLTFNATGTAPPMGNTHYLSPSGNDANDGSTGATPWKTFDKAFTTMAPGDELILLDGTYSAAAGTGVMNRASLTGSGSRQPISGVSLAQMTVVRAANRGQVTIEDPGEYTLNVGTITTKTSYLIVDGILFEGGGTLYNTSFIYIKNSGFHHVRNGRPGVFSAGTGDHTMGNSYILVEDSWVWGRAKKMLISYNTDHVVYRRVLVRGDGCSGCDPNQDPNYSVNPYNSNNLSLQNIISFDHFLDGGRAAADFTFQSNTETPETPIGLNEWLGMMVLNSDQRPITLNTNGPTAEPAIRVENCVLWNNPSGFAKTGRGEADVNHCTINVQGTDARGMLFSTNGTPPQTGRNSIVFGNGKDGLTRGIVGDIFRYINLSGTWTGSQFRSGATCDSCVFTDPTADGATPSLLYPTRVEAGSALKGAGENGTDIGANVVYRYGVTGAFWGDPNYNALSTTDELWPWPNEALIRTQMCATITRGWCATSKSFTDYVWEQMGNTTPGSFVP